MIKENLRHNYLEFFVFLGILILLAQSCIIIADGNFNWKPYREEGKFQRTFSVQTPAKLEISNGSGDVKIFIGKETEIKIDARVRVYSRTQDDAKKLLDEIISDPPVSQSGNKVTISHPTDWGWSHRSYSIDYEIQVPEQTEVDSSTGSGDQFVDGVSEPVRLSSGSGDVEAFNVKNILSILIGSGDAKVENVKGDAEIRTGSGDVRIENTEGNLEIKTGSGDIQGRNSSGGYIKVLTGSGDIEFDNLKGNLELFSSSGEQYISNLEGNVNVRSSSGSIYLNGKLRKEDNWEIHSTSGDISINLPSDSQFNLNARTSSGSIDIDFPLIVKGRISRKSIEGSIGSSNSNLFCTTTSGDIKIRKL